VTAGLAVSAALYGLAPVFHMRVLVAIARRPFEIQTSADDTYLYQSPVGPLLAHLLGVPSSAGVALVALGLTFVWLTGSVYVVRRFAGEHAARLMLVAFF